MFVHKIKPAVECLSLEEINRLLKLSVYDDKWIQGICSEHEQFIILVEQGFTRFSFDMFRTWGIIYMLNIIPEDTWKKRLHIQRLDYMVYEPWQRVDSEKLQQNLIMALKHDRLSNRINYVNLNALNQSHWLLTLYDYRKIIKYVENNIEHYEIVYGDGRRELHKFIGFDQNKFQWDWNNMTITRSHNLDGINFYRKVILKIETIYYFQIFNKLIIQLTGDVVQQIKYIIIEHLTNNLYFLLIQE